MLQMRPEMEMMMRVMMDVNVIVDWPRADNFTSKQLTAVRKPEFPNIKAVKIYTEWHRKMWKFFIFAITLSN